MTQMTRGDATQPMPRVDGPWRGEPDQTDPIPRVSPATRAMRKRRRDVAWWRNRDDRGAQTTQPIVVRPPRPPREPRPAATDDRPLDLSQVRQHVRGARRECGCVCPPADRALRHSREIAQTMIAWVMFACVFLAAVAVAYLLAHVVNIT